jgi:Na+-transporting methylmalonyl-CoA/oxaloacetate decarboxylase gamma subunit
MKLLSLSEQVQVKAPNSQRAQVKQIHAAAVAHNQAQPGKKHFPASLTLAS